MSESTTKRIWRKTILHVILLKINLHKADSFINSASLLNANFKNNKHSGRYLAANNMQLLVEKSGSSLDFNEWATAAGIKFDKVKTSSFSGLRGLEVKNKIYPGEDFITVPNSISITTTSDQLNPLREILQNSDWQKAKWYLRLALQLLHEKSRGAESKLHPYISQLPPSINTPFHWDEQCIELLQYPYIQQQVLDQRSNWTNLHKELVTNNPNLGFSFDELAWGMECAYSRTFSGPYEGRPAKEKLLEVLFVVVLAVGTYGLGFATWSQVLNGAFAVLFSIPLRDFFSSKMLNLKRYAMCPVIDLINHKSSINSDVSYNYFKDCFAVFTKSEFNSNEQVFISYGPKSNDYLLQYYGFVEENNPHDVYTLMSLPQIIQEYAQSGKIDFTRWQLVKEGGLLEQIEQVTFQRNIGLTTLALMPVLRLLFLSDEEISDKLQLQNLATLGIRERVSSKNEEACWNLLLFALDSEILKLQDVGQQKILFQRLEETFSESEKLARLFRIEKCKVLKESVTWVRKEQEQFYT